MGLTDDTSATPESAAARPGASPRASNPIIVPPRAVTPARPSFWNASARERLNEVVDLLKFTSQNYDDPQQSVLAYASRMEGWSPADRFVAISRRGLAAPQVRVTRSSTWDDDIDPWREAGRLPLFSGGLLSELIHAGEPRLIESFTPDPNDPAIEFLRGMRSAIALPTWDNGEALNMVVQLSAQENAFSAERLPEMLWISNLFGRLTKNLVLARQVKEAYEALDRELKTVADIQMSLLPRENPELSTLELATHYQSSTRAGGDYYDFFDLGDGLWGILIADVSGHGTPAAVLMAILHAIAHVTPMQALEPHEALSFINRAMTKRYTLESGAFVTMIYATYDEHSRTLRFANAGHPRPIVLEKDGRPRPLGDDVGGVPLGILDEVDYETTEETLTPGQALVFYTDGITEAFSAAREMFGERRLEASLRRGASAPLSAGTILGQILEDVGGFAGLTNRSDDRTIIVGTVK